MHDNHFISYYARLPWLDARLGLVAGQGHDFREEGRLVP